MRFDPLITLSANELKEFMAEQFSDLPKETAPKEAAPTKAGSTKRKIVVAILAYDAKIYCRTMMSLMTAMMDCTKQGWEFAYVLRESDSMVARGRSFLASQFLENPGLKDGTDLVFIDTDLAWSGDEFIRLCNHPVDVIGAAYPYKDDNGNFPLRWPSSGLIEENGLWVVDAITPGFMRITRKALERIASTMPWLQFADRAAAEGQRNWMFFDNTRRNVGIFDEGYTFCELWRQCGGCVYLDPEMNLTHIGIKAFNHGNIRQWLDKKSETFEQLEAEFPHIPPLKLMHKVLGESADLTMDVTEAKTPRKAA